MKTPFYSLILCLFLFSCTASSDQETKQEDDPAAQEAAANGDDSSGKLPEENAFSYLFTPAPCDAISQETAAQILGLTADQVKVNANASGTNSCSWGYYPADTKQGININVQLTHQDAGTTRAMFEDDEKNRTEPVMESRRIEVVNPDLDGPAYSTYRQGRLHVFVSEDSFILFQIGPTVPPAKAEERKYKEKVIAFAEAFMNR